MDAGVARTRMPRAERRAQLIDTAVEVFARRGFHGTSMDDIADTAGITKPVLYQHFISKAHLYGAIVQEVGREIGSGVRAAHHDPDLGDDPIDRASSALAAMVLRLGARARLLTPTGDVDADVDNIVTEQRRYAVDGLTDAITETTNTPHEEAAALSVAVFAIAIAASAEPEWRAESEQGAGLVERKATLLRPLRRALLATVVDR